MGDGSDCVFCSITPLIIDFGAQHCVPDLRHLNTSVNSAFPNNEIHLVRADCIYGTASVSTY